MSDLLYFVGIILVIGWVLGVFAFSLGAFIHFLVFALIAILFQLIIGRSI